MRRLPTAVALLLALAPAARAQNNLCDEPGEAPDLIVGAIISSGRFGTLSGITAYGIGVESCNIGTCWANWIPDTPDHPLLAQNMFRLKDGRFEQIGQSWLKHGYGTLDLDLCGDCLEADGTHLGVNCSDPYGWNQNGAQADLGPKFEVNPSTGTHPHPYTAEGWNGSVIYKRLQVHDVDLDPALNAGALYFVEVQYVAADDGAAGNNFNNAAYRQVTVSGTSTFTLALTGETFEQAPAVSAWAANDPSVELAEIGGAYVGAVKVTPAGAGTWRYEYALQNLISHDSARSVRIPIPHGATVGNIGFHDVDYHSGEPYSGADWTATVDTASDPNAIVWSTQTFLQNPNANALRWGTLYNFRFDIDAPAVAGRAVIAAFRTGGTDLDWPVRAPQRCGDSFCDADESHDSCAADCAAGPASGEITGSSLRVELEPNGDLTLLWSDSCVASDDDYEVYEGKLGDFTSHQPRLCSTGGASFVTLAPLAGFDTYYLVVPTNGSREGSYGRASSGAERPPSALPCLPRAAVTCP